MREAPGSWALSPRHAGATPSLWQKANLWGCWPGASKVGLKA